MPIMIDFSSLVRQGLVDEYNYQADWTEWRYCYEAGNNFRNEYLNEYSDRETSTDFARRKSVTPIPAFARREINRVKNSISQRFPDITRRGGSKVWREAVIGQGRGVDRRGSSMSAFIALKMLAELLVMGKVGVLVDAPRVKGSTLADVPKDFRPYLNLYVREFIPIVIPAPVDSTSDFAAVLLEDHVTEVSAINGTQTDHKLFRYYYLDPERGNKVTIQKITEDGVAEEPPILTDLTEIPFVMFDIGGSLIKEVCSHQIALLNMISSDSSYAIDSNFPFMVRQRGNTANFLVGEEDEAEVGQRKGLFYDKNLDAPAFISPPTEPMQASLALRKELKDEVRELVTGAIADLGDDGTIDSGLAFIGQCLANGENRLWDHWGAFEFADATKRKVCTISYPETWSLKTDQERIEEADALLELMNKLPGQKGKKEAAKMAYDKLYRGKLAPDIIDGIKAEVDAAAYTTSNPDIIEMAKVNGICDPETAAVALGFNPEVAAKAEEAQARRAAAIVAAQADADLGAAKGVPDLSKDPNSNKLAREGQKDPTAKLGGDQDKGVRGDA